MTPTSEAARDPVATMLRARSIAVVGASDKPESFGRNVVTHLRDTSFSGRLYPVNPRYAEVAGLPCFESLADVSEPVDCAVLAVADERLEAALASAAHAGARSAVIFGTAIEAERPGSEPLTERLAAIAREARMPVCGSNCMGFLNFVDQIMVGGWPYRFPPPRGSIGFITHSGSSYSAFALNRRQLAMSYMVSAGQEIVTGVADYLQFLVEQPETRAVGCIIETAREPERFLAALDEADRRGIPVVALKLGRSEGGQRMARAHSGALAGSDSAYRAVFERHNVIPVRTLNELAETLELVASPRAPTTDAVGIATDSGGERAMMVDIAADLGLRMATLTEDTTRRLAETLDPGLAPINPVDVWGTGHEHERIAHTCLQALADDPGVGQVVLASNMPSGRQLLYTWGRVAERVHEATTKPVIVMGHLTSAFDREEAARLRELGLPVLLETQSGMSALVANARWHERRRSFRDLNAIPDPVEPELLARWRRRLDGAGPSLDTAESLALVADFGVPVVASRIAEREAEAAAAADALGYPVVLKTLAQGIDHKFDCGGVVLGLKRAQDVAEAYRVMAGRLGPRVLVQAHAPEGVEVFVGMLTDPQFGPLLTIGIGGVFVEVLKDVVTVMPPIDPSQAVEHLRRLKGFALLEGARGRPRADLDKLAHAVSRFSLLAAGLFGVLSEMDVNPVIAGPIGAFAVDALAVTDRALA